MFEDIDADVYVMADGDDTYPADAAPAMVAKVLEGYDMVIGDRLSSTYFSFTFVKTYPVLSRGFEVETEMTIHSPNNDLRLFEMPIQYRDRPEGSVSKLDTVGDGIKVMSTIFRMIREYKPLPFFGGLGLIIGVIGLALCGFVTAKFVHTGMVGLLLIVTGIILDVIAKNDRKTFLVDANTISYMHRNRP